jgi:hypothetical protein
VSLANIDPRYNTTFPVRSPCVGSLKDYGLSGTTYYTKAEGGQSTVDTKTAKKKGANPKDGVHFNEKFVAKLEIFWIL